MTGQDADFPKVSILIAVRNEAEGIINCLQSIDAIKYPRHLKEVWIANDHSEDDTALLVENFIRHKPYFHLVNITHQLPGLQGKANALAQLAQKASGQYYFITDGDMVLPDNWIVEMLKGLKKADMVNGVTTSTYSNPLEAFQAIDWLVALGHFTLLNYMGVSYTAMGNNMCISKQAYWAVGGYESIPFSITEDYALFKSAINKGFKLKHLYHKGVLAHTRPQTTFRQWLWQRTRWFAGANALPWYGILPFYVLLLWYPLLFIAYFVSGWSTITILLLSGTAVKWLLSIGFLIKLNKQALFPYLPVFEFIWPLSYACVVIRFYTTRQIAWKGRMFDKK
jgi:cellulose synthase/poly-beta-1,6-N-acetylglucosamine synthase-like glycosyltransferase